MKKETNESFDQVSKLLAFKRLDQPSEAYFNGVLGEFHRRQRAALLQPKSVGTVWWESFVEAITLQPARVLRYGMSVACVLGFVGFVTSGLLQGPATSVAKSAGATGDQYAFDGSKASALEQNIDRASMHTASSDNVNTHYVFNDRSSATETSLAF